ncbi:hypothetical protein [Bradyrhizobium yuanmingense]|uniref:hypothetical protein n=1 Tax=Bradyrhizobium yuanmingense TaxID=108015 RepID=UPI001CD52011|nr:hypothetical protein [Bradyrhizobium yuanmingense]MCA1524327.1 hypothetical protein [Bradyrhizobium yuanmingense]
MRITEAMIEAAAIAIRDAVANRVVGEDGRRRGKPWAALPAKLRDAYRAEAAAALHAALEDDR